MVTVEAVGKRPSAALPSSLVTAANTEGQRSKVEGGRLKAKEKNCLKYFVFASNL
jgi:hypothetical protein